MSYEPHLDAEDSPEYKSYEAQEILGDLLKEHPELNFISLPVLMEVYLTGYARAQHVLNKTFNAEPPF